LCAHRGDAFREATVVVVANWREQQFFTHAECLRARMHPEVAVHAQVLDAPTG
jgi:hypothetical protein